MMKNAQLRRFIYPRDCGNLGSRTGRLDPGECPQEWRPSPPFAEGTMDEFGNSFLINALIGFALALIVSLAWVWFN